MIPVYNEPEELVRATLASWKAVRYTAFEIIVADDSTVPLTLGDLGVRTVHRTNRAGFKGGAMRNAFDQLDPRAEWMLVFDADFVVELDVLVRSPNTIAPTCRRHPGMHVDGPQRAADVLFTRYSESFHAVADTLLTGRYRMGGFVGVQGTVQAYNVKAVHAIGGIAPVLNCERGPRHAFRMRKAGRKIIYDPRISGRGIAPDRFGVFFTQLTRWTSTTVREYRRHWWSFVRSRYVPWSEKVDSVLFLLTWTIALAVTPTLAFIPWVLLYVHLIPLWLSILITLLPLPLFMLPAAPKLDREARGHRLARLLPPAAAGVLRDVPGLAARSVHRPRLFARTPKSTTAAAPARPARWTPRQPRSPWSST